MLLSTPRPRARGPADTGRWRRLAALAALSLAVACGTRDGPFAPPSSGPVRSGEPRPSTAPVPASEICPVAEPRVTRHDVFWAWPVGSVDEVTWAAAQRMTEGSRWTTLLLALGPDGRGLVEHDLGVRTLSVLRAFAVEGSRIRMLYFEELGGPAAWSVVDVADAAAPRAVVERAPVPGLAARGWIDHVASDGERVVVAMGLSDEGNHRVGFAVFLLAADGSLLRRWDEPARAVFCRGACGFLRTTTAEAELVVVDRGGTERRHRATVEGLCHAAAFEGARGDTLVGLVSPAHLGGWRVSGDGHATEEPARPSEGACDGSLGVHQGRLFVSAVPRSAYRRDLVLAGRVLRPVVDASEGLEHSVADEAGIRFYYEVWQMRGARVDVLRHDGTTDRSVTLPFSPREGQFTEAPLVTLLARDGYVASLLTGSGGRDTAELAVTFEPCRSR